MNKHDSAVDTVPLNFKSYLFDLLKNEIGLKGLGEFLKLFE